MYDPDIDSVRNKVVFSMGKASLNTFFVSDVFLR